jgi:hypothetical protein
VPETARRDRLRLCNAHCHHCRALVNVRRRIASLMSYGAHCLFLSAFRGKNPEDSTSFLLVDFSMFKGFFVILSCAR